MEGGFVGGESAGVGAVGVGVAGGVVGGAVGGNGLTVPGLEEVVDGVDAAVVAAADADAVCGGFAASCRIARMDRSRVKSTRRGVPLASRGVR